MPLAQQTVYLIAFHETIGHWKFLGSDTYKTKYRPVPSQFTER